MADSTLPTSCDVLIRVADLIDGSGAPRRRADVAVTDDRVVALGDLAQVSAGRMIDASGLVLAPGFIDVHTHDDFALLNTPEMTPKVSQGVTT
ncbi:MAG: amidohydrolase family protein, partial [Rhodospirillaceae bacterium]|nr:amidohydrolase family protein [Rhodospirillaceae bacterium]